MLNQKWAALVSVFLLFSSLSVNAVPIAYNYDDSGATSGAGFGGSGMFTLDVGDPLGSYFASDVMGGPGTSIGAWTGVRLNVEASFLSLRIQDISTANISRSALPGLYGLTSFTSAATAWDLVVSNPASVAFEGVAISRKAVPVPTSLALMGLGLAGIGYKRYRVEIAG